MAPGSGTTSFAVTHPVSDRYNVVAPWGRIVATFSTREDGALAEAFAHHHARLETATLHLAAAGAELPRFRRPLACGHRCWPGGDGARLPAPEHSQSGVLSRLSGQGAHSAVLAGSSSTPASAHSTSSSS